MTKPDASLPAEQCRQRLDWSDDALLAECRVDLYRASGPGGQHRNKVSSAIRLTHHPSGLVAFAVEARSQHENRASALRRLRELIALEIRCALPATITWPPTVNVRDQRIRVNESNPGYPHALALALDAVAQFQGRLAEAGAALGLSGSSLTKFLAANHLAWARLQRMREQFGLKPLKAP
ncbi:MAG: peptide chain release factor-like protein [Phycisphaerales bacterium]|nr:peptide chain release factor-like protein [Phycisphaerales bacterium]